MGVWLLEGGREGRGGWKRTNKQTIKRKGIYLPDAAEVRDEVGVVVVEGPAPLVQAHLKLIFGVVLCTRRGQSVLKKREKEGERGGTGSRKKTGNAHTHTHTHLFHSIPNHLTT